MQATLPARSEIKDKQMMGWHDGMSWWGWLMMLVFWGLVILGIVVLVRSSNASGTRQAPPYQSNPTADDILAERFARGEIDEQEYVHEREVLHSSGGSAAHGGGE